MCFYEIRATGIAAGCLEAATYGVCSNNQGTDINVLGGKSTFFMHLYNKPNVITFSEKIALKTKTD